MNRIAGLLVTCIGLLLMLVSVPAANATSGPTTTLADGVTQRTTYTLGPIEVTPGQNRIAYRPVFGSEKPSVSGYITKIVPNLVDANGNVPLSSKIMFHHGVWLNLSGVDATTGGSERFFATGEEKTQMEMPPGYGLHYKNTDVWLLNHMLHNLTPEPMELYVTYQIDMIPDSAPEAASITPVRPIWMDVENGSIYPVFDVHRGEGGKDGEFTYPNDLKQSPYPEGVQKNEWTVDRDGILIGSTGHVHTGGLATDLYLMRPGAKYAGPRCKKPKKWTKKTRRKMRKCVNTKPSVTGNRVHLFESTAHYFEPAGPVSWDVAMLSTRDNWKVGVKAGDTLELTTTYETKMASWYESMGIAVTYMADAPGGRNPYVTKVDGKGIINHGHYAENNDHGGKLPLVGPDPTKLPDGLASGGPFNIGGYSYGAGNFRLPGSAGRPPVVQKGQTFTFNMTEPDLTNEVWHSLTSCKSPCNKSTGIAYPIADGDFQFDSGQMGNLNGKAAPPTVGRTSWTTPANLPVGTHTFYCRIHPLMRGAIRVVDPNAKKKKPAAAVAAASSS